MEFCGMAIDNNNYIGESYYGDSNSEEETLTTAAKCEFHINQQPVIAVIDSGAAVSIMTTNHIAFSVLTYQSPTEVKMSKNSPVISYSHEELINLEDALDLNSISESKTPDTSKPEVKNNLKSFAENLGLKFAKKEDLKKFYDFAGPDFIWPSKMSENDHLEIFEFIVDPEWEDIRIEIAINALTYHRLVESGAFKNKPKGSYVLIVHGEVL
ncbi:hypothetical protein RhiirA5_431749 [Rhizophagus irregularis]|uniref:Uncharacterized protein n=1 Tax=Rhizophagus irregularis TaxID=588596 RepID=A0A2N0NUD8_9GLOM|nr:hypothetical protein RhiirA5_431749 [Rhizophagus irregularis]